MRRAERFALPPLAIAGFFVARVPFDARLAWVSSVAIVAFALPSLIALWRSLPPRRAAALLAGLSVFAIGIEALSITTGFPYSRFVYTQTIGVRLFGLVPWTVPLAWIPLALGAAARFSVGPIWRRTALGALYLIAVDLLLDPAAVKLSFWRYEVGSAYYNVPLQNFAGWALSGGLAVAVLHRVLGERRLPSQTLVSLLCIVAFWTSVCAFAGLWIPALVGAALAVDLWRMRLPS